MIDFEMAFLSSFIDEFPTVDIKGSFFYFRQCLWRKVQTSGLQVVW